MNSGGQYLSTALQAKSLSRKATMDGRRPSVRRCKGRELESKMIPGLVGEVKALT